MCGALDQEIRIHRQLGPPTDCTELIRSAGTAVLAPAADQAGSQQSTQIVRGGRSGLLSCIGFSHAHVI